MDTGADNAAGKLTFNIDGLARAIAPLRDACHWAENKNMAMDLRDPNVWISHLLENLPEEKLASALKDDNPNWEYIDGEIVKLGSLAHSQLDIPNSSAGAGHSGFGE